MYKYQCEDTFKNRKGNMAIQELSDPIIVRPEYSNAAKA